jgi:hypothetical protein
MRKPKIFPSLTATQRICVFHNAPEPINANALPLKPKIASRIYVETLTIFGLSELLTVINAFGTPRAYGSRN